MLVSERQRMQGGGVAVEASPSTRGTSVRRTGWGPDLSGIRLGNNPTVITTAAGWNLESTYGDEWKASGFQLNIGYEATPRYFNVGGSRLPVSVGARINLLEPDIGALKAWTPELYAQTEYKPNWRHAQPFVGVGARVRMPSDKDFAVQPQQYLTAGVQSEYARGWKATLRYADELGRFDNLLKTSPTVEIGWGYDV
eukprot:jgi/Chlat1/6751/Chrsp50S06444